MSSSLVLPAHRLLTVAHMASLTASMMILGHQLRVRLTLLDLLDTPQIRLLAITIRGTAPGPLRP